MYSSRISYRISVLVPCIPSVFNSPWLVRRPVPRLSSRISLKKQYGQLQCVIVVCLFNVATLTVQHHLCLFVSILWIWKWATKEGSPFTRRFMYSEELDATTWKSNGHVAPVDFLVSKAISFNCWKIPAFSQGLQNTSSLCKMAHAGRDLHFTLYSQVDRRPRLLQPNKSRPDAQVCQEGTLECPTRRSSNDWWFPPFPPCFIFIYPACVRREVQNVCWHLLLSSQKELTQRVQVVTIGNSKRSNQRPCQTISNNPRKTGLYGAGRYMLSVRYMNSYWDITIVLVSTCYYIETDVAISNTVPGQE